jgi:hypothetical protein
VGLIKHLPRRVQRGAAQTRDGYKICHNYFSLKCFIRVPMNKKSNFFSHFLLFFLKMLLVPVFSICKFYIKNVSFKQQDKNFQTGRGSALE